MSLKVIFKISKEPIFSEIPLKSKLNGINKKIQSFMKKREKAINFIQNKEDHSKEIEKSRVFYLEIKKDLLDAKKQAKNHVIILNEIEVSLTFIKNALEYLKG